MLLSQIEGHLRRTRMAPTRFGRDAMGDPKFVLQLRDGREPRKKTIERVMRYLDEHRSDHR